MGWTRRELLNVGSVAVPSVAIAGLSVRYSDDSPDDVPVEGTAGSDDGEGGGSDGAEDGGSDGESVEEDDHESDGGSDEETDGGPDEETDGGADEETGPGPDPAEVAVAAEWTAMRARLWDALALGRADEFGTGATVARRIVERFEGATGEYGAREVLERTDESAYREFETALDDLRIEGLERGDLGRTSVGVRVADEQLRRAQRALVGETATRALEVLLFGVIVRNAAVLSTAGHHEAATTFAETVQDRYGDSDTQDALASADSATHTRFEGGIGDVISATERGDGDAVRTATTETLEAAVEGSYAVADSDATADAGYLAAMQSQGYDAVMLASMGGPSQSFAHAATLTTYRTRASDAVWIALGGETERAESVVRDVLAEFESARARDGFEEAAPGAYEGFETGLEELASAIAAADLRTARKTLRRVNRALVAGVTALGSGDAPAVLEAVYFRARIEDVRTLHQLGERDAAATTARMLFRTFEANEANFRGVFEQTNRDDYGTFEEELSSLQSTVEDGNDGAVESSVEELHELLLGFEAAVGSEVHVGGAEATYVAAQATDAAGLSVLGRDATAEARLSGVFEYFEAGAGGFREAIEEADRDRYESFGEALAAARTAAGKGGEVYPWVRDLAGETVEAVYAVVSDIGGPNADAAADLVGSVARTFETAEVGEALESGDSEAYEAFEDSLQTYASALRDGGDARAAADEFASAALRAQFVVAGAVDRAPVEDDR